jgi:hypothetical protein
MAYNGSEGGKISRTAARTLMLNYRNSPAFAANNQIEGILFGREQIEDILALPECVGIRVYYGKDGVSITDPPQLILVGIDSEGGDLVEVIVDMGMPCPTHCPPIGRKI